MEKMVIESLKLKGFRNHKDLFEITLSPNFNTIIGDNGLGKTTVGEAIAWILYGCNLYGNDKADSQLMNRQSKVIYGKMIFSIDGKNHTIVKERKGRTTAVLLDGKGAKQLDVLKLLPPKELFFSIFYPDYFMSMGEKERRDLIINFLPNIPKEIIFKKLEKPFQEIFKKYSFLNSNALLKEFKNEKKEFEKDIIYLEGQLDLKKEELKKLIIPQKVIFSKEEELKKVKIELSNIRNNVPNIIDLQFLRDKKLRLKREIEYIEKENSIILEDTMELEKELSLYGGQVSLLNQQVGDFLTLEGTCPTCQQPISEKHTNNIVSMFLERIEALNSDIDITQQAISHIKKINKEKERKYLETKKQKIRGVQEKIKELDIEKIIEKNKKTLEKHNEKVRQLENVLENFEREKRQIEKNNYEVDARFKQKMDIEKSIENIEKEIERIRELNMQQVIKIQAVEKFNSTYANELATILNHSFNKVKINLYKLIKSTGELKDCFEIHYEGKDYRLLSSSEKKKTGLEIANLLMRYSNIRIPIFIDDAESITKYEKPDTQLIEAKVVEGKELTILTSENSESVNKNIA